MKMHIQLYMGTIDTKSSQLRTKGQLGDLQNEKELQSKGKMFLLCAKKGQSSSK